MLPCAQFDTYLVTALYRLHRMLEPCSAQKINSLYCFDSIARACRSKVKKGLGARIDRNTGTFAGFLQQVEGILDPLVDDLVQRQDWKEGRVSTLISPLVLIRTRSPGSWLHQTGRDQHNGHVSV